MRRYIKIILKTLELAFCLATVITIKCTFEDQAEGISTDLINGTLMGFCLISLAFLIGNFTKSKGTKVEVLYTVLAFLMFEICGVCILTHGKAIKDEDNYYNVIIAATLGLLNGILFFIDHLIILNHSESTITIV